MENESIIDTLEYTKSQIERITDQISIGKLAKVELKNILENLRSVLDYLSGDILSSLKRKTKSIKLPDKVYFPYGQRENHFKKSIKRNLPSLKEEIPEIYNLLRNIQPFVSNDNWVVDLCSLTNDAKHNQLSKTINKKSIMTRIGRSFKISGAHNVFKNNYENGRKLDDVVTDESGMPHVIKANSFNTSFIVENRIRFEGKEIEVLPFLLKCHTNILQLTKKIKVFI